MTKHIALRTPSYRHHKSSGQAVVTICGRDHYLGEFGTPQSRKNYDRLIAEWLAAGRNIDPATMPIGLTITELIAAHWRFAQDYYKKNGRKNVELVKLRIVARPLRRLYGRTPAAEFGPLRLKAIREEFLRSGFSRRYINDQIGRLKRMFRWGAENELVPGRVYRSLQAVAGLRRGRRQAAMATVAGEFLDPPASRAVACFARTGPVITAASTARARVRSPFCKLAVHVHRASARPIDFLAWMDSMRAISASSRILGWHSFCFHAATAFSDSALSITSTSSMIARAVVAMRSRLARKPLESPCHRAM